MTTNRLSTLQCLVRNRVGLAIVPQRERPAEDDSTLASCRLIGRGLVRKIGTIRLQERELSPAAERFFGVVRRWIRAPA
jgi:DNA-binding transcriptional LysR family regulator